MKSVAVTLAASLGLLIGGCAGEKPMHGGASLIVTPTASDQPVDAGKMTEDAAATPSAKLAAVGISASSENSSDPSAEVTTDLTRGGTAGPGNDDGSVRDAKEAAEDAARRIFDATVEAASRIKDAGVGAVQAVRETTTRKNDDSANQAETEGAEIPGHESATADSAHD